jgi:hypothetical protein
MSKQDNAHSLKLPIIKDESLTILEVVDDLNNNCSQKVDSSLTKDEELLVSLKEASYLDYDK